MTDIPDWTQAGLLLPIAGIALALIGGAVWLRLRARNRLRRTRVTVQRCRRDLVERGWIDVGSCGAAILLNRGDARIALDCISGDPATLDAVRAAIHPGLPQNRQKMIVVPGAIESGVTEDMLGRDTIVLSYGSLADLDGVLHDHRIAWAARFQAELRPAIAMPPPPLADVPAVIVLRDHHIAWAERQQAKQQVASDTPAPPLAELPAPAPPALRATGPDGLIAETPNLQCFLRDQGGETLLIAFNDSWRHGPAGRLLPSADMAEMGFSILDIVTRTPNWFPAKDMAILLPSVLAHLAERFPLRATLGFSQGGYGALKFSRVLGASTTMAFSPQFSIDQSIVQTPRFARFFRDDLHLGMAIGLHDCACPAFVFYDPYDPQDRRHVELIREQAEIVEIRLPFAGHATGQLFATPERLRVLLAVGQAGDRAAMVRLGAESRHANRERSYLMALELARTKPGVALQIGEVHGSGWSVNQQPQVCYRLALAGKSEAAMTWMQRLAAAHPENSEINGCAALVALEARQVDQAAHYAERARALNPNDTRWLHAQARVRKLQFDHHA